MVSVIRLKKLLKASPLPQRLSFPFTLTALAENFLFGRPDLDDTIKRLQAFEEAGADVLYAPGLRDLESIRTLCSALSKPVNVVMGLGPGVKLSIAELSQAGVKRISLGSSLARAAIGAFLRAANEIKNEGSFDFAEEAISFRDLAPYLEKP